MNQRLIVSIVIAIVISLVGCIDNTENIKANETELINETPTAIVTYTPIPTITPVPTEVILLETETTQIPYSKAKAKPTKTEDPEQEEINQLKDDIAKIQDEIDSYEYTLDKYNNIRDTKVSKIEQWADEARESEDSMDQCNQDCQTNCEQYRNDTQQYTRCIDPCEGSCKRTYQQDINQRYGHVYNCTESLIEVETYIDELNSLYYELDTLQCKLNILEG